VHSVGAPFTSHRKPRNYAEPKLFSWAEPAYFDFSSSNFKLQGHILSTAGDDVSASLSVHSGHEFIPKKNNYPVRTTTHNWVVERHIRYSKELKNVVFESDCMFPICFLGV
jgi:hypothetical protein